MGGRGSEGGSVVDRWREERDDARSCGTEDSGMVIGGFSCGWRRLSRDLDRAWANNAALRFLSCLWCLPFRR